MHMFKELDGFSEDTCYFVAEPEDFDCCEEITEVFELKHEYKVGEEIILTEIGTYAKYAELERKIQTIIGRNDPDPDLMELADHPNGFIGCKYVIDEGAYEVPYFNPWI